MPNGSMMKSPGDEEKERVGRWRAGEAISLGTNLAAGMAVFTFLGYYVDHKRGGGVACTLAGMGLGLLYGAYEVWKVVRLLDSGEDK